MPTYGAGPKMVNGRRETATPYGVPDPQWDMSTGCLIDLRVGLIPGIKLHMYSGACDLSGDAIGKEIELVL